MNMPNLYVKESYVNATKGYTYGDPGPQEAYTDDPGELFRTLRNEYGRCIGKVYVDAHPSNPAPARAVGWVFVKRMRYEDARPGDPDPTYLREVWVTLHDAPDTVTRTPHYHAIGG
jgi:hypothetical protein